MRQTRKRLKQKVDEQCKRVLKLTKPFLCRTCPSWGRPPATEDLHWGHLITATKIATRWDLDNLIWQCNPCNLSHEHYPEKYTQWFIDTYGYEKYKDLIKRSNARIQNFDKFYKEKLAELEKIR